MRCLVMLGIVAPICLIVVGAVLAQQPGKGQMGPGRPCGTMQMGGMMQQMAEMQKQMAEMMGISPNK